MKTSILGFSALFLVACSAFGASEGQTDSPPPPPAPPGAPPPVAGTPMDGELTETFGVFVTQGGAADGDGSRAHPLGTIQAAIALAAQKQLRVYVCQGSYAEQVTLKSGVSVYGGYICDDPSVWSSVAGQRSRIEAPASPALRASDIGAPTRLEGFDVVAPKGAPSSIALLASNAGALTIANGSLTASDAADGAPGATPAGYALAATMSGGTGYASDQFVPSKFVPIFKQQTPFSGGAGGASACGVPGGAGAAGGSWVCTHDEFNLPLWTMNADGNGVAYRPGSPGAGSGAQGANGSDGASATHPGALTPEGYVTADGTPGTDGRPGGGGAGGAAESAPPADACHQANWGEIYLGASGAGGGAGGCPGLAGKPGKGGGASIGALLFASGGLVFDGVSVKSGNGGAGGAGSFGSDSTFGGAAGATQANAGAAQQGGIGGAAGVSGSGAGGPSFGIAHTGGTPTIAPTTKIAFGAAGKGVAAAQRPDLFTGKRTLPASADGVAADVHAF